VYLVGGLFFYELLNSKSRDVRRKERCPLYPRKQTCAAQIVMSAKGQKRTQAAQQKGSLFDQLVGECKQIHRYIEVERFGSCEVNDEVELGC
jgi:hypothetical protein